MNQFKFRLLSLCLLGWILINSSCSPTNALSIQNFNLNPFQSTAQQTAQLRQTNSLSPLNSLMPISPIAAAKQHTPTVSRNPYHFNQYNQQNHAPIAAYQNELNLDGSFSYSYADIDGTTAQAQGYVKNLGYGDSVEAQVIQGSYSYTSPEGSPITVHYIADENGFRTESTDIPTPRQYFNGVQPYRGVLNLNLNPYQTPLRQFSTPPNPFRTRLLMQQQQQRTHLQQNSGHYQPEQH